MKNWKFFVEYTDGSVKTLSNISERNARDKYNKMRRECPDDVKSFGYEKEFI